MKTNDTYQTAKKRIEAKIALRNHVFMYLFVNILLVIINLFGSPDYFWAKWPIMGWGIALLFHAINVFIFSSEKFSVTEEMIQKEIHKDN